MKGIFASLDDIIDKYDDDNNIEDDESLYNIFKNNYKIERINSNTGTIISDFNKKYFIADAKYRVRKEFKLPNTTEKTDIRLPMLNNFRQGLFNNYSDDLTSKENTDGIIQLFGDNSPAANYVRSLIIPELGSCDLPSFSLFESFIDYASIIDDLDASLKYNKYKRYSLSNLFSHNNNYITSTCYSRVSRQGVLVCHKFILVHGNKYDIQYLDKRTTDDVFTNKFIVIPVIEI